MVNDFKKRGDNMQSMGFIVFGIILTIILVKIIYDGIKGVSEWSENNSTPKTSVGVRIIDIDRRKSRMIRNRHLNVTPQYTVTFLFSDNDKKQFDISAWDYKWIAIDDEGIITMQGTRFISFKKNDISK